VELVMGHLSFIGNPQLGEWSYNEVYQKPVPGKHRKVPFF